MASFLSIGVKKINLSHFGRNWDLSESRDILREGGVLREEYPYLQSNCLKMVENKTCFRKINFLEDLKIKSVKIIL